MRRLIREVLKNNFWLLVFIILIGVFLRAYKLLEFPVQLNHDEITQLYDAISIAQTGKDIYGNFMPVVFESINDFKPPFYTYITSLVYLILGDREVIIRIPSVFFGILTIPAVFLFTLQLVKNYNIAIIAALITAVSPFEIFFSRKSFENGAGIFFMLLGFYFLFTHFDEDKLNNKKVGLKFVYFGIASLAIGMYTYFSHAVIIPMLLLSFIFIFRKKVLRNMKKYLPPLLLWVALVIPLLLIIILNPSSRYRSQAVFIIQDLNLVKLLSESEVENSTFSNILRYKTIIDFSFQRYLNQLDPIYLFANGLDFTSQGPLGVGPLMLIQLPFLIIGFIFILKTGNFSGPKKFVTLWLVVGLIPSGLTFEPFSPHRVIMVFTMLNIITALGVYYFFNRIAHYQIFNLQIGIFFAVLALFIFNFIYFVHMYTINLPYEKSQNIHYPFKQVALYMWSKYNKYNQIIFDPWYGQHAPVRGVGAHYYLGYYGSYPPAKFQEAYKTQDDRENISFDKFSIRDVKWPEDQKLAGTLIVASPWRIQIKDIEEKRIMKTFYFYDGQPAFYAIKGK